MIAVQASTRAVGYASAEYARAFAEWGEPLYLPHAGGYLLKRPIPGTEFYDATNCYPLLSCNRWSRLADDLKELARELVSLVVVTDPFAEFNYPQMLSLFRDVFRPFKYHYVIDLSAFTWQTLPSHHRRNVRKASRAGEVERCTLPEIYLSDWKALYANLIHRHHIRGIAAFSEASFEQQFRVPGLHVFRAVREERTVGMILWIVHHQVGYYHLAAYNEEGYHHRASYALFWNSIRYFQQLGLEYLNLGGVPGTKDNPNSGLARFKRGWATDTRLSYLAGIIFQREVYHKLLKQKGVNDNGFFPAYRSAEFA